MSVESKNLVAKSEGNEMVVTRFLAASPNLVWRAGTDPARISKWWGPDGFTTTTRSMEMRAGGTWRFTMHGPDGRDYDNRIEYVEVDEPHRLAYRHQGEGEDAGVRFQATIDFHEKPGGMEITFRMTFPSEADLQETQRKYGAFEGLLATVERLDQHVAQWPASRGGSFRAELVGDLEFRIVRQFKAPKRLVYEACTKPEHLKRWWGCAGATMTVCEIDLRVGGKWHYVLQMQDGSEHPFRGEYLQILPNARISNTFIYDVDMIREHPAIETLSFEEHDGLTTLTCTTRHTTREARDGHYHSGVEAGSRETFERLDLLLNALAADEELTRLKGADPLETWDLDREVVLTRVLNAPREKVFQAWMEERHLIQWFGPHGLTIESHECCVQPGGRWRFDMVAADGTRYDNRMEFLEILPNERIVLNHGSDSDNDPGRFRMTIQFDSQSDGKTVLTLRQLHPTKGQRDGVIGFGAVEYGLQTLEKLATFLQTRER